MLTEKERARAYLIKMRARERNKKALERSMRGDNAAKKHVIENFAPLVGFEKGWGKDDSYSQPT